MEKYELKNYIRSQVEYLKDKSTSELLAIAKLAEQTLDDDRPNLKYCRDSWRERALGDMQAVVKILVSRDIED